MAAGTDRWDPMPELRRRSQLAGLARAGLAGLWNGCWHCGPGRRLATILIPAVGALVWVAATPVVVQLLRSRAVGSGAGLEAGLTTLMVVLFAFTLATSISFALASIYFARDVEWLLLAPISSRLFLSYRLLSQLGLGAAIGAGVAGPVVLAAAVVYHSPGLVPLVALAVGSLLLVPMAVAMLVVVALVRVVPANRVKEAAGLLVGVVGFGVAALDLAASVRRGSVPGIGISDFSRGMHLPGWLSPTWAAQSIFAAAHGRWGPALLGVTELIALAAVVTFCAIWLSGPLVREGWFRAQTTSRRGGRGRPRLRRRPVVLAVLRKDWRTLRRDPAQLVQLLLPIGLFAVYLLSPRAGGLGLGLFHNFPSWYGPMTTAAFAALFAASGIGLRAVGSEGRQFWCLRTAPVSTRTLLLSKLVLPGVIATTASLTLMVTSELRSGTSGFQMLFSALLLSICVVGLSALATGLGAIWPRLDWTDPRRAVGVWLAIVFMMLGAAYIAVCVVGLTLALLITNQPSLGSELFALVVLMAIAGLTAGLTLKVGHSRLQALDV